MFDPKPSHNNSSAGLGELPSEVTMARRMTRDLETYDIDSPLHKREMHSNVTLTTEEEELMSELCKYTPTPEEVRMSIMCRNFWHGFAWQLVGHTRAIEQGIVQYKLMIKENPNMSVWEAYQHLEKLICKMVELDDKPKQVKPNLKLVK